MQFHKAIDVQHLQIGDEASPLIIIDNFVETPEHLVNLANENADAFQSQASDFYPGIRKPAPAEYQALLSHLPQLISSHLPSISNVETLMSAFSIATTPEQQLRPIQTIPHFDSPDPQQYALVHYLCTQEHGGTSFYQHKSTGFERITKARLATYGSKIKHEAISAELHKTPRYIDGETSIFSRIYQIEAAFNRAIIYPSNLLHSGNINVKLGLIPSACKGRLTLSSFIYIEKYE